MNKDELITQIQYCIKYRLEEATPFLPLLKMAPDGTLTGGILDPYENFSGVIHVNDDAPENDELLYEIQEGLRFNDYPITINPIEDGSVVFTFNGVNRALLERLVDDEDQKYFYDKSLSSGMK